MWKEIGNGKDDTLVGNKRKVPFFVIKQKRFPVKCLFTMTVSITRSIKNVNTIIFGLMLNAFHSLIASNISIMCHRGCVDNERVKSYAEI